MVTYDRRSQSFFSYDYCGKYFDLVKADNALRATVRNDFCSNLKNCLTVFLKIDEETAWAAASSVYCRMSCSYLHFHNPVKILAAFQFAYVNGMGLEVWERLALWFHCAVFNLNESYAANEINESQSIRLMRAVIPGGINMSNKDINLAERSIISQSEIEPKDQFAVFLDLTKTHRVFQSDSYKAAIQCLRSEYVNIHTHKEFIEYRKANCQNLLAKPLMFKSKFFNERFDNIARRNIFNELSDGN